MKTTDSISKLYQISSVGMSLGLERMHNACKRLGSPEKNLVAIQVAGTNGKGSVCGMLERVLRCSGKKTGLFTSPHIHRFTERIRINGEEISIDSLGERLQQVLALTVGKSSIPLTFFEVATLAALLIFQEEKVDVAVLEVGLGGRLDATSVVTPKVGVITSIGFDHMDYLGHSLGQIAREKAGIGKKGIPVVCGALAQDAKIAIDEELAHRGAVAIHRNAQDKFGEPLNLQGSFFLQSHQQQNAALVFATYQTYIASCGNSKVDVDLNQQIEKALAVFSLPARFEFIPSSVNPKSTYLIDGAHNEEAVSSLVAAIRSSGTQIERIVFGALQKKPASRMLELLMGISKQVVIVPAPISRSFDAAKFASLRSLPLSTISESIEQTVLGTTLVTGSFFVAAEARRLLLDESSDPPIGL